MAQEGQGADLVAQEKDPEDQDQEDDQEEEEAEEDDSDLSDAVGDDEDDCKYQLLKQIH